MSGRFQPWADAYEGLEPFIWTLFIEFLGERPHTRLTLKVNNFDFFS
jgi:hypothetical protein